MTLRVEAFAGFFAALNGGRPPFAWQSRHATPRLGRSERRSSVGLNCCCGKGVSSRRRPSSCFGLSRSLNSS